MKTMNRLMTIGTIWGLVGIAVASEGRTSDMESSKANKEWMVLQTSPKPIFAAFPRQPTEMRFGLPGANGGETGVLKVFCTEEAGHTFFLCTLQGEKNSLQLSREQLQKTFRQTLVPYLFYEVPTSWGEAMEVGETSCCNRPALAFQATSNGEWLRGLTFLENGQVQHILFLIAPKEQWDDLAANTFLQSVQVP